MLDLLIITKRNNHGKYFKKVENNSRLRIRVHYIFPWELLNPFNCFSDQRIDKIKVCNRQLQRKRQCYPKLLSYRFFQKLYLCMMYIIVSSQCAQYSKLFLKLKPKRIATWNGEKAPYHTIVEVAKAHRIPVLFFENGLLPNTTTLDFKGVNAKNSLPRASQFYREFAQTANIPNDVKLYQRPLHKKREIEPTINLPTRFLFIPLQVPNDSQIIVNSPWIRSMEHLFTTVIQSWQESPMRKHHLVFKAHPSWPCNFSHLSSSHDRVLFANNNDTQELIEKASAVITINSTVGIESLLLGKPVVTLGNACYNIEDLVLHASSSKELDKIFDLLPLWEPDESVRQGFIAYLKHIYCVPQRWSVADKLHFMALDKRLCGEDEYSRYLDSYNYQNLQVMSLNLKKSVNF